jgi:hypothetical protein
MTSNTSLFKTSTKLNISFFFLGKYTKKYNNQGITKSRKLGAYIPYI